MNERAVRQGHSSWGRLLLVAALVAAMAAPTMAGANDPSTLDSHPVFMVDDVVVHIGDPGEAIAPQASDPLDLVGGVDTLRDHSLGRDVLEVWTCGLSTSAATLTAQLEANVRPWFLHQSRGRYEPVFVARGDAGSTAGQCRDHSRANADPSANGAIHLTGGAGGFASAGFVCGFTPCAGSQSYRDGNARSGFVGTQSTFYTTAVHEIGHMIQWPHSFTGVGPDEYDVASDVMSGNYGTFGSGRGSYPDPYGTAAINLYAAGWIDPNEVYMFSGGGALFNLATQGGTGHKMAVIRSGSSYFTLAARVPSTFDPMPAAWAGVEVYRVDRCASEFECMSSFDWLPGFRRTTPSPAVPFDWIDEANYSQPLPHVISAGETRSVGGVTVTVEGVSGQSFSVAIGPDPQPIPEPSPLDDLPSFTDTSGSVFAGDIEWLAASGITRGCNPPVNDRFCPDAPVTRGAMAAFLVRALGLTDSGATFADTSGHVFENDIARLAAAGITRGCNPPANTRFCPDQPVTRGAMAAFLARALGLTSGGATFADTSGHVFENDIARLAAAGITRGCNPPSNDRFCPNDPVTRGAMAAFMKRALGD